MGPKIDTVKSKGKFILRIEKVLEFPSEHQWMAAEPDQPVLNAYLQTLDSQIIDQAVVSLFQNPDTI